MSPLRSAGLLPFRIDDGLEVLLAHPGGPYFTRRDDGWWSLVKGLVKEGESDDEAARREFSEETGWEVPSGEWVSLGVTTLKSRKVVRAWALQADLDPEALDPGHFVLGKRTYPEIDRVDWFRPEPSRIKLNREQGVFIDRLESYVAELTASRKEPK